MPPNSQPQIPNQYPLQPNTVQSEPAQPKKYRKEEFKNIVYTVILFIFAPLFALFMIMFVFQSYVVDGSSMEPTMQNGNRVFILKLPKTWANARGKEFIPTRYEVIVFKKPSDPSIQLIKRVIGLPGDHVIVKNNKITIYNNEHPAGYNPDQENSYTSSLDATVGNVDITVGENELFVCGDNRSPGGSLDSRSGLGLVPVQNIVGRLWVRYFPLDEIQFFSVLVSNPQSLLSLSPYHK